MNCVVLTRNPSGGGIVAITDDEGNIQQWPDAAAAVEAVKDHTLIRAWGGWVIDLDFERVTTA